MALKDDLRPTGKNRLMDLVAAAGVSVAEWANFDRAPKFAATNPKFCYEWSFVEPGRVVVLNIWHDTIRQTSRSLSVKTNLREVATRLRADMADANQIRRAEKMDAAIALAFTKKLPVRVIVGERDAADRSRKAKTSDEVTARMLDPVPWTIKEYSLLTGDCLLVRGGSDLKIVDQYVYPDLDTEVPNRVPVSGFTFQRSAAVRDHALRRSCGRCEYCGCAGFLTSQGEVFLETHHVVPLSVGGSDTVDNVAAICPTHHREAHHGAQADFIRTYLLDHLQKAVVRVS